MALNDREINLIGANYANLVRATDNNGIKREHFSNLESFIKNNKPDIAVDFSTVKATKKNCLFLVENGIKCIIGITGLLEKFLEEFKSLVIKNKAPSIISSNMATGVNIFFKIASILALYLEDWDIEIIHNNMRSFISTTH